jgi:hypothetical protein
VTGRTIKFVPDTDIIEVRYAGEISYEYRIATLDALERMLPTGGFHRLLINYTSAWPTARPHPRAVSQFGAKLGRVAFAQGARIALVNAPSDLGEQTADAATPGGFLCRQFQDRALAIAWLSDAPGVG